MRIKISINSISGISGLVFYLVLSAIAFSFYPSSFSPMGNWLSDLGNNLLNPEGAIFYRLAGILSGAALLAFFLTLSNWTKGQGKAICILFALIRVFGLIASLSFIMTGVFSEDMMPTHSWFSIANYITFGTAIALTGFAVLFSTVLPRWFSAFCFLAWVFDIISGIFGQTMWLEWVVVVFLIMYVAAMSVFSLKRNVNFRRQEINRGKIHE
jgi:hypothetical protein